MGAAYEFYELSMKLGTWHLGGSLKVFEERESGTERKKGLFAQDSQNADSKNA